jgi:hydroxyacylglutathione hydrolase
MTLIPLPALTDNYIWLLHDGHQAVVVDPGDAQPVLDALQREHLTLQAILVTHHHHDHVGGIEVLRQRYGCTVYGPARESIPQPFVPLHEGDTVRALGQVFNVLDVPGHTAGHIAFYAPHVPEAPILWCGDTLFSAGCGRLFDGTAAQLFTSLTRLAQLPETTRVCCTHEYTLGNLQFARTVNPSNTALASYQEWCEQQRHSHLPTLPSSIGLEKTINPFLRSDDPEIIAALRAHDAVTLAQHGAFAALRQWKNHYP